MKRLRNFFSSERYIDPKIQNKHREKKLPNVNLHSETSLVEYCNVIYNQF